MVWAYRYVYVVQVRSDGVRCVVGARGYVSMCVMSVGYVRVWAWVGVHRDGCMRSKDRGGEYVCTELAVYSHEREL